MQPSTPNPSSTGSPETGFNLPVVVPVTPIDASGPAAASAPAAQTPAAQTPAAPAPVAASQDAPASNNVPVSVDYQRDTVEIWNMPFDLVTLDESIEKIGQLIQRRTPSYAITANLNYVMLHNQDAAMGPITRDADLIVADGQPIVLRSYLTDKKLPERVAGSQMIYDLARTAAQRGWKIYFLGGEPGVAETCANRLVQQYPGFQVAGIESPPFRKLSDEEQLEQDQRIQASGADILLVAFGQPKGEKWIHENYKRLGVPVSIQLGASFDFVAGTAKRAPEFWQKIGMEWFYRMMCDPGRLVKRYSANALFLAGALLQDWTRKVASWGMSLDGNDRSRS